MIACREMMARADCLEKLTAPRWLNVNLFCNSLFNGTLCQCMSNKYSWKFVGMEINISYKNTIRFIFVSKIQCFIQKIDYIGSRGDTLCWLSSRGLFKKNCILAVVNPRFIPKNRASAQQKLHSAVVVAVSWTRLVGVQYQLPLIGRTVAYGEHVTPSSLSKPTHWASDAKRLSGSLSKIAQN